MINRIFLPTIAVFIGIYFLACDSDPVEQLYADIDIVTGMDLFDPSGLAIGTWREANDNRQDILAYPVPSDGSFFVNNLGLTKRIMIIPARCYNDTITENIRIESEDLAYDIEDIEALQVGDFEIDGTGGPMLFQPPNLSQGFYRLFYIIDNETIYRQNIYIDPAATGVLDLSILESACP